MECKILCTLRACSSKIASELKQAGMAQMGHGTWTEGKKRRKTLCCLLGWLLGSGSPSLRPSVPSSLRAARSLSLSFFLQGCGEELVALLPLSLSRVLTVSGGLQTFEVSARRCSVAPGAIPSSVRRNFPFAYVLNLGHGGNALKGQTLV